MVVDLLAAETARRLTVTADRDAPPPLTEADVADMLRLVRRARAAAEAQAAAEAKGAMR